MQSFSSRIWTQVAMFISYGDNHFSTGTSNNFFIMFEMIPHRHFYNARYLRGEFGRHFLISSLSYNAEYSIRNASAILRILTRTMLLYRHNTSHLVRPLSDCCPVSWCCKIHLALLCRGVRPLPSQWVSWIWCKTIWWSGSSKAGALGNAEYHFIAIAPRSTLSWNGSTW